MIVLQVVCTLYVVSRALYQFPVQYQEFLNVVTTKVLPSLNIFSVVTAAITALESHKENIYNLHLVATIT